MSARSIALQIVGTILGFALSCLVSRAPSAADLESVRTFDIKPQRLESALIEFSKQADLQVIGATDTLTDVQTQGVSGQLTSRAALTMLLENTSIAFNAIGTHSVQIVPIRARTTSQKESTGRLLRLAQASLSSSDEPTFELEEVIVTGSHIRGAAPAGSNVLVIDREEIEESGYGRLQDLLELLPQNFSGVGEDLNTGGVQNLNRGAEIQLRGLGAGTTLTLVNGQRQASSGAYGAFTDISSIPSSAIERVEILTDGASALYGSDAIGGVVNFILRKNYSGAETHARFGTSGGDADERQLSQIFGTHWSSGRALLGYQYYQRDPLRNGDRAYTASGGDLREFGGSDFRVVHSNPGNIVNAAGQVLFAIPRGQDGTNLTPADLLPGVTNYRDESFHSILPEQESHNIFVNASQSIGERVEVNLDARYVVRDTTFMAGSEVAILSVPSTNPFYVNPSGGTSPVRVAYDFAKDVGPVINIGQVETLAGGLATSVRLFADWQLSVSGSYGKEVNDWERKNRVDPAARNAAIADTNPATALNVFGDVAHTNPATLASMRRSDINHSVSRSWSAAGIIDGSLFQLGGGPARLAVGVDHREERLDVVGNFPIAQPSQSARDVSAAFAELALPLVGEGQAIPGVERLAASLAARYDEYSDAGSTFNPKIGLTWSPWSRVDLRGTWGTSFRAPPFYLNSTSIQSTGGFSQLVNDPRSPTGRTMTMQLFGTRPDLNEETAEIWTAGMDFALREDVSISLTYFDIDSLLSQRS